VKIEGWCNDTADGNPKHIEKICHSFTLATKRSTVSALRLSPRYCREKTATGCLCHGICLYTVTDAGNRKNR